MATHKKTNNNTKTKKQSTSKTPTKKTTSAKQTQNKNSEKETNAVLTVIGIIVLVIVAIVIFNLTYAFFTANVIETGATDEDVEVITADLLVRYEDDNKILESKIKPGDTISKEFRVINEGTDLGKYSIVLQNFQNTFSVVCPTEDEPNQGEIQFSLYKYNLDENGNKTTTTTLMSTGILPCVNGTDYPNYTFTLYSNDGVEVDKTNYYLLSINYKNLSIDQSDNMDKGKLEALINIVDSGEQYTDSNKPKMN